jgi:DNA-binding Lrp family transcriptional regulator
MLVLDARMSLKDIAKECNISSVSVLNRIKRLKKMGVITGATLFTKIELVGFQVIATIGMETNLGREDIEQFFTKHAYLIEPSTCVGVYDLCALVCAENISSLNEKVELLRRRNGIKKVIVNVWANVPHFSFENLDLQPKKNRVGK